MVRFVKCRLDFFSSCVLVVQRTGTPYPENSRYPFRLLERDLIRDRVSAGVRNARACGKELGRPRRIVDHDRLVRLKAEGVSLRQIAEAFGVGYGTVRAPERELKIKPSARVMLGGAYSDLTPDAYSKNNLSSLAPTFKTNDTAVAVIGGGGIDYVWKSHVSFRVTGDYIPNYISVQRDSLQRNRLNKLR